ncbi:Asp23/Gls24 family envelope stress response protein [Streptomyces sp. NPDC005930]|uniref:Asp23/Gls24 family envelope stress response protein n=1 Tax=Streptomyces sp. NPDC005930 TaxID=3364736 RepID=UPI003697BDEC
MTENTGVRRGGEPGSRGRTTLADAVVTKIAGMAAREVSGVHALGGGAARALGSMRERMPGAGGDRSAMRGVSVEVGEVQAAVDLEIVVDYGVPITDLADTVRENVISAVERMAGREVVEVNILVSDMQLPDEDEEEGESRRIQ